jgi:hypothetical protein
MDQENRSGSSSSRYKIVLFNLDRWNLCSFVVDSNHRLNAAPNVEITPNFTANRINGGDNVIQDSIGNMFVENPLIPVGEHVKFQGFQLDDLLIRDITDMNGTEIRLTRLGAHCRELGTLDINLVFPIRVLIRYGFQF